MASNVLDVDPQLLDEMRDIIQKLTHSGKDQLDEPLMKNLKQIVK